MRIPKPIVLLVAAIVLSFTVVQTLLDGGVFFGVSPASIGMTIDARTATILGVQPGSAAARAGVRAGDQIDVTRTSWTRRLWLRRGRLQAGNPTTLALLRDKRPITVQLKPVGPKAAPASVLAVDLARVLGALIDVAIGCALYFVSPTILSLAFMVFCLGSAAGFNNTAWMTVAPPWGQVPLSLVATMVVLQFWGYLTFCLRFPTGSAIGRWRWVDRAIPYWAAFIAVFYLAHFYTSTFLLGTSATDPLYSLFSVIVLVTNVFGAIAFMARYREARGSDTVRMRWVGLALAVYLAIFAAFFADQGLGTHSTWVSLLQVFNPAPYAFAYAMLRGRIVDVRIFGGRALVYASLTAIPVALLAIVEWFVGRRLEDARLATALEVLLAVAFSFWLRGLHRRIDRFVERVFFANRHRAFERVRHITRALPFSEHIVTIETMLTDEVAGALQLASAAVFREEEGVFVRVASRDWGSGAQRLDADDPLILFARSSPEGVHVEDVPVSRAAVPVGDAKPAFALPIAAGRRMLAVALYGNQLNGESIDGEQEALLVALAHAAAAAYEHLHALEREREIAFLRGQLNVPSPT